MYMEVRKMDLIKHSIDVDDLHKIKDMLDPNKEIVFACIGTMRSPLDSVAPRIGSILSQNGYNVIGTQEYQLHAKTIPQRYTEEIEALDKNIYQVVALDACIPTETNFNIIIENSPIKPGLGVSKTLMCIGDYAIKINSYKILNDYEEAFRKNVLSAYTWLYLSLEEEEQLKLDNLVHSIANKLMSFISVNKAEQQVAACCYNNIKGDVLSEQNI